MKEALGLQTIPISSFRQLRSFLRNKATLVTKHQFSDTLVQFADQLYRFGLRIHRCFLSKHRCILSPKAIAIRKDRISLRKHRFCLTLHHNCLTELPLSVRLKGYISSQYRLRESGNQCFFRDNQCIVIEKRCIMKENQCFMKEDQCFLIEDRCFVKTLQRCMIAYHCFIIQAKCLLKAFFRFLSLLSIQHIKESLLGINHCLFRCIDFFAHRSSAGRGDSFCPTYLRKKTIVCTFIFKSIRRTTIV